MNASVERLYAVNLGSRQLGQFTLDELKALHRVTSATLQAHNGETDAVAIVELVANHFNIPPAWLIQRHKTKGAKEYRRTWPRQIAMTLIHEQLKLSSLNIGQIFGRHHGAVLHAWQIVQTREKTGQTKDVQQCRAALAALLAERKT